MNENIRCSTQFTTQSRPHFDPAASAGGTPNAAQFKNIHSQVKVQMCNSQMYPNQQK